MTHLFKYLQLFEQVPSCKILNFIA